MDGWEVFWKGSPSPSSVARPVVWIFNIAGRSPPHRNNCSTVLGKVGYLNFCLDLRRVCRPLTQRHPINLVQSSSFDDDVGLISIAADGRDGPSCLTECSEPKAQLLVQCNTVESH
jgi:hypothetical protein